VVPREWWDAIKEAGLEIVTIGGHGSLTDGLNRKENHARIEEEILRNLELAKQYGIKILICFSGNRRGMSDEEGIENTAEGLRRVAKAAEEAGVTSPKAMSSLPSATPLKCAKCEPFAHKQSSRMGAWRWSGCDKSGIGCTIPSSLSLALTFRSQKSLKRSLRW
jgi:hypothetical protein